MTKKLPSALYVKIEKDNDVEYFFAAENIDELASMGEKVKIGVYFLDEIVVAKTVIHTDTLSKKRKRKP